MAVCIGSIECTALSARPDIFWIFGIVDERTTIRVRVVDGIDFVDSWCPRVNELNGIESPVVVAASGSGNGCAPAYDGIAVLLAVEDDAACLGGQVEVTICGVNLADGIFLCTDGRSGHSSVLWDRAPEVAEAVLQVVFTIACIQEANKEFGIVRSRTRRSCSLILHRAAVLKSIAVAPSVLHYIPLAFADAGDFRSGNGDVLICKSGIRGSGGEGSGRCYLINLNGLSAAPTYDIRGESVQSVGRFAVGASQCCRAAGNRYCPTSCIRCCGRIQSLIACRCRPVIACIGILKLVCPIPVTYEIKCASCSRGILSAWSLQWSSRAGIVDVRCTGHASVLNQIGLSAINVAGVRHLASYSDCSLSV